jgi:hypothetical protein
VSDFEVLATADLITEKAVPIYKYIEKTLNQGGEDIHP